VVAANFEYAHSKDIKLTYVQTGMEAAQLLAAGKAESALLSEPAATAAIMMAAREGRSLRRAVSLQQVWAAHHGGVGLPMVGAAVFIGLLFGTGHELLLRGGGQRRHAE